MSRLPTFCVFLVICFCAAETLAATIPAVHSNVYRAPDGSLYYIAPDGDTLREVTGEAEYTLEMLRTYPVGTEDGIKFDFGDQEFDGTIYYGLRMSPSEMRYSYPIYYGRPAKIISGVCLVDIANRIVGKYDFVNWQESGKIRLGYRIVNDQGQILYDGKIRLRGTGPFEVDTSIVEGPFINLVTHQSAVVSFITNIPVVASVTVIDREFTEDTATTHHEIALSGLQPHTEYAYSVKYGPYTDTYSFRTAPKSGSRLPFTFAYASDGRGNSGGGERDIKGVNAYMLKKISMICALNDVRFFQFTGDLIDGYTISMGEIELEYANWKRAAEPYACYFPFIAGFGNHEVLIRYFQSEDKAASLDRFPYGEQCSESVFARNFVNPLNGPESEDGAEYDPNPDSIDFPSYKESVFYYTYDNVAMVSLNTNYWFAPSIKYTPEIGGNLHGYIMDNQLAWLEETLAIFESDVNIDHIFVTLHTPVFPNGGHVRDDMWYSGSNDPRAWVAGKPLKRGIIERRDELLNLLMNKSSKVRCTLTGDEHNYSLLRVDENLPIYPDGWTGRRLTKFRPIWHINNGAAGAPYYGQEETPWSEFVEEFSTQNAVVLFHVHGDEIEVEVINPDTGEELDRFNIGPDSQ